MGWGGVRVGVGHARLKNAALYAGSISIILRVAISHFSHVNYCIGI